MSEKWEGYYKATHEREPHALLVTALTYVKERERALDLGAGAGRDTRFLLAQGFKTVDVVEQGTDALHYLPSEATVATVSFSEHTYPSEAYNLVNAQFSLPFNPPDSFEDVIAKIKKSLKAGGVFTGQFFGKEDGWAEDETMTFHTKEDVEHLLNDLEIFFLEESQEKGKTAIGGEKNWHIFNFIVQKQKVIPG